MSHPSQKTRTQRRLRLPAGFPADRIDPDALVQAIVDLFPADEVQRLAKETGFQQRERKLDVVSFLLTLALETGPEIQKAVADLHQAYNDRAEDPVLSYGGFYEHFTPELAEFLRQCVLHALPRLCQGPGWVLKEKLARFTDVLAQDSTVIRLAAALATVYPATRSRKVAAGVKVATLHSFRANGPKRLELTGERTSEYDTLKIGPWVKNALLLTDLGFYKHQGFARIEENGGFYLSRLKDNANPTLMRSHLVHRGASIDLEGKTWKEVAPRLQRGVLDAEVELRFSRRSYGGRSSGDTLRSRLVAVWDEEHREYHAYLTNVPPDVLTAEEVAEAYRLRWEVELLFREAKGVFRLDQVRTKNRYVAEAMIWTGWLTLLVSRRLHNVVREALPEEWRERLPSRRWAKAFVRVAGDLLNLVLARLDRQWVLPQPMAELAVRLEARALDPNLSRERFRREWMA